MNNLIRFFSCLCVLLFSCFTYAEEEIVQVGKHVTPSTDAPTMILSLLLVLLVVIVSAFILKKFQGPTQGSSALKVVSSLHLGTKEKIVVVQVGEKQLLLGVTPSQITVLETLEQPFDTGKNVTEMFDNSIVGMLKKSMNKNV